MGGSGASQRAIQGLAKAAMAPSKASATKAAPSAAMGKRAGVSAGFPSSSGLSKPSPPGALAGAIPQPAKTGRPSWAKTCSKLGISMAAASKAGRKGEWLDLRKYPLTGVEYIRDQEHNLLVDDFQRAHPIAVRDPGDQGVRGIET
jgi:hypothetical protein